MTDNEGMEAFKSKILGVLKYSISFFEKNDINWFIACGSALGTVRHKGFIPWDDDIDVYMPRKDFNRLIALRDGMLEDGYKFICMGDDNYPLAFGKIMDNRTTLWSQRKFPINYGAYIDIFPLDLTDIGMMSFGVKWVNFRMTYYQYRAKIAKITIGGLLDDINNNSTDNAKTLLAKIPLSFIKKRSLLDKLRKYEASWNKDSGDRYISYTEAGMYMFPKEWFEEYIYAPFEDITVRLPKHYHEYLTYMYGDYMTPPPIEKRHSDGPHGKYYVNLQENVPLNKVNSKVRKIK